jgi:RND family efflux transporter MFP subunit
MKISFFLLLSIVLAGAGLWTACHTSTADDKLARLEKLRTEHARLTREIQQLEAALGTENPDTATAREVAVITLAPRAFDYYVQTQGFIEVEDNIQVSARSAGVITRVLVQEGEKVSKGQTLAQIDNSLILQNIEEAKTFLELATTVAERQSKLWERKIGTEVQYLQAKNSKESLEKRLATLYTQNEMTLIKAPISGIIDEVNIKEGENLAPGMPSFRVINTDEMKVTADVSEVYISTIAKGDKVIVSIPDLQKVMEAQVTFVSNHINPLSRTFAIEVELPSLPSLHPNMAAVIKVVFHKEPSAIVVPVNIVQEVSGEKIVYVAEVNGERTLARKKMVEISDVYDNQVQVTSGLHSGDKIITTGFQGLSDGEIIRL